MLESPVVLVLETGWVLGGKGHGDSRPGTSTDDEYEALHPPYASSNEAFGERLSRRGTSPTPPPQPLRHGHHPPLRSDRTCRARFDSNTYSPPAANARQLLTLKASTQRVLILDGDQLFADHPRSYERRRDSEIRGHIEPLLDQRMPAHRQRQLVPFLTLGPAAQLYWEELQQRRPAALTQVQRIVALSESHGVHLTFAGWVP